MQGRLFNESDEDAHKVWEDFRRHPAFHRPTQPEDEYIEKHLLSQVDKIQFEAAYHELSEDIVMLLAWDPLWKPIYPELDRFGEHDQYVMQSLIAWALIDLLQSPHTLPIEWTGDYAFANARLIVEQISHLFSLFWIDYRLSEEDAENNSLIPLDGMSGEIKHTHIVAYVDMMLSLFKDIAPWREHLVKFWRSCNDRDGQNFHYYQKDRECNFIMTLLRKRVKPYITALEKYGFDKESFFPNGICTHLAASTPPADSASAPVSEKK